MRIISPFKDYYDSALAYGSDPNIVYNRNPALTNTLITNFIDSADFGFPFNEFEIGETYALVYCGKLFSFFGSRGLVSSQGIALLTAGKSEELVYDIQDFKTSQSVNQESILPSPIFGRFKPKSGNDKLLALHKELDSPIFITSVDIMLHCGNSQDEQPILVNPCLRNLKFQSVFDPFSCFQEISMFLANELAPLDIAPLRTGNDKTIARAKGFDDQSFRTAAPGHKKLNRQANRKRKSQTD